MAARPKSHSARTVLAAVLTILILWLNGSQAWAHNVNVYAYTEGDTVHVKGYFSKGPARNCPVVVFSPEGTKLLEGKTDSNGEFSFKAPARSDLRIHLVAGEGHSADYILKAMELPEGFPSVEGVGEKAVTPQQQTTPEAPDTTGETTEVAQTQRLPAAGEIERIIERVVEKKVAPIRKMLLEQREEAQGATFEKVLAGIGIIFGLMGLTVYLRTVWRRKES